MFYSYEADENTSHATAGAAALNPPDPTSSGVPSQPIDVSFNQPAEHHQLAPQEAQNMYQAPLYQGTPQNGAGGSQPGFNNMSMATGAEPESQGTGIKEDG